MHIRINISGKRRPEKACYKQQAVLKIMVEQKKEEKKKLKFPSHQQCKKKNETQLNQHNFMYF